MIERLINVLFYPYIIHIISLGGMFFGYAQDVPDIPAKTILAVMVKCLFSKKKFLEKLIPCATLNAEFLFETVTNLTQQLEEGGGKIVAVINDNNKVNQSFFSKYPGFNSATPFVVYPFEDQSRPLFLLYDPVHIVKKHTKQLGH